MSNSMQFHARGLDIVHHFTEAVKVKEPHFHNFYEFIYIIQGKAEVTVNNRVYQAGPHSLLAISNLEKHHWRTLEIPYERYCIVFKPEYFNSAIKDPVLSSVFRNRPDYFSHLLQLSVADNAKLFSLLNQMREEMTPEQAYWEVNLRSLFRLFIVSLYRSYSGFFPIPTLNKTDALVLEIQKYLENNCQNDINLQDVAKEHFIDMYYLSHLFKKVTGFSFKEYLILQRISKAKDLLFYTMEDITEVGMSAGFNNINHFIRIFKKYEGVTPYQYRKRIKSS